MSDKRYAREGRFAPSDSKAPKIQTGIVSIMPVGRPKGQPRTGGRVAGTPNHATAEVKELARVHGPAAIERLAGLMAAEGATAVAACRELLDRAYGKSPQPVAVGGDPNAPPVQTKTTLIYSGVLARMDEKI